MKLNIISILLFLFVSMIYNLYGDYTSFAWNNFYYIGLYSFIIIQLATHLNYCFIWVYRYIIKISCIYFSLMLISEVVVLIKPKLYDSFIINANNYLSGSALILCIMVSLIYLIFKENDTKSIRRWND